MGLFTKSKKAEAVPVPSVTSTARKQLEEFIKGTPLGTDVGIPTREVEGLSDLQKEIMRLAGDQATSGDFDLASGVFREAAQAGTDPSQSPEFAALREQIGKLSTERTTGIRQRGELAGQLKSTPTQAIEAESEADLGNFLITQFAEMQRRNQQDKQGAALGLVGLGGEKLNQLGQASQIADQERIIEQARNDAVYNQALQTVLLPYNEQLQLLNVALGQKNDFFIKGGGLTDLGFGANLAATVLASS
jgi:hypothetical protein